jgi:hypothetical protein
MSAWMAIDTELLSLADDVASGDDEGSASVYSSTAWNRTFADPGGKSFIAVATSDGERVGSLSAHLLPQGSANTVYDAFTIAEDTTAADRAQWRPQLMLGSRNGQWNTLHASGDTPRGRRQVIRALLSEAMTLSASSYGLFYVDERTAEEVLSMDLGFIPYLTETDATIPINEGDFTTYLDQLPAKRRSDARREIAKAGGLPHVRAVTTEDQDLFLLCGALAAETQARHGQPGSAESLARYLCRCVEAGFPAYIFHVGPVEAPSAFSLGVEYGGTLWIRLVGLRYDDDGGTSGRYPSVLVYGPVAHAAGRGLGAVNLGAGLSDFKRRRGATAEPRWTLLKPPFVDSVDTRSVDLRNRTAASGLRISPERLFTASEGPA